MLRYFGMSMLRYARLLEEVGYLHSFSGLEPDFSVFWGVVFKAGGPWGSTGFAEWRMARWLRAYGSRNAILDP